MKLISYLNYLCFVGGLLLSVSILFFMGSQVNSFDWFKIWTSQQNLKVGYSQYAPSTSTDDAVTAVALANMRIGNGEYHVNPEVNNVFGLMNQQRALLSVDIMELLNQDASTNKEVLNAHIRHLQLVTEKTTATVDLLKERAQRLLEESNACLTSKREGDQKFFEGVQQWNDSQTQEGLSESLSYAPCYITKRIEANASSYLASYLGASLPMLQRRQEILLGNIDNLINYKGLLEGTLLDDLQNIKKQVLSINLPTSTDVDKVFSFFKFDENTVLPTYNLNTLWFPNGKIPTFQDPGLNIKTSGF